MAAIFLYHNPRKGGAIFVTDESLHILPENTDVFLRWPIHVYSLALLSTLLYWGFLGESFVVSFCLYVRIKISIPQTI